jgi:hypothetical protein
VHPSCWSTGIGDDYQRRTPAKDRRQEAPVIGREMSDEKTDEAWGKLITMAMSQLVDYSSVEVS